MLLILMTLFHCGRNEMKMMPVFWLHYKWALCKCACYFTTLWDCNAYGSEWQDNYQTINWEDSKWNGRCLIKVPSRNSLVANAEIPVSTNGRLGNTNLDSRALPLRHVMWEVGLVVSFKSKDRVPGAVLKMFLYLEVLTFNITNAKIHFLLLLFCLRVWVLICRFSRVFSIYLCFSRLRYVSSPPYSPLSSRCPTTSGQSCDLASVRIFSRAWPLPWNVCSLDATDLVSWGHLTCFLQWGFCKRALRHVKLGQPVTCWFVSWKCCCGQ